MNTRQHYKFTAIKIKPWYLQEMASEIADNERKAGGEKLTLPRVMPVVIENARTAPEPALASGGNSAGACMQTRLARWPFVKPSSNVNTSGQKSDLHSTETMCCHRFCIASCFVCQSVSEQSCILNRIKPKATGSAPSDCSYMCVMLETTV